MGKVIDIEPRIAARNRHLPDQLAALDRPVRNRICDMVDGAPFRGTVFWHGAVENDTKFVSIEITNRRIARSSVIKLKHGRRTYKIAQAFEDQVIVKTTGTGQ